MLSLFTWLMRSEQGRKIALGVGGMLLRRWIARLLDSRDEAPAQAPEQDAGGRSWWPLLLVGAAGAIGYWVYRSSQREEPIVPDWTPLRETEESGTSDTTAANSVAARTHDADAPDPDDIDGEIPTDAEMDPTEDETRADETIELPAQPAVDLPPDDDDDEVEELSSADEDDANEPDEGPDLDEGRAVLGRRLATDDLKVVEGVGPKIERLLGDNGIDTWHDLAEAEVERLQEILREAGSRFHMHDPSSWPEQAALLERGAWQEFASYADRLDTGEEK